MELVFFVIAAIAVAIAAQLRGVDSRDMLRPSERTGSHAPLTVA